MDVPLKRMTQFLRDVGADGVEHSDKSYLAHAVGVHNDMRRYGCDEEMCRAGVFHSIYGTELFQRFTLPLERRGDVRALIGERAEWFAYLNCAMDRAEFDRAVFQTECPYQVRDRFTGEEVPVSAADFDELVRLHVCDWLEQVGRSKMWDYRRKAYRQMAKRVGGIAEEEYQRAFAEETAEEASA
ncbi:MAG: DUF6817 domain-containing protein [Planctomycetaceae bacterium]